MPELRIREAVGGDLAALALNCSGVALESEGLRLDPATLERGVQAVLRDPARGRFFVLADGDAVVASLFVTREWSDWHVGWYWWIQSVYVVPARRGEGLYRKLYEGVREAARREGGVLSVRLYVEAHNEAGLRAYRGLGMKETAYRVFDHPL